MKTIKCKSYPTKRNSRDAFRLAGFTNRKVSELKTFNLDGPNNLDSIDVELNRVSLAVDRLRDIREEEPDVYLSKEDLYKDIRKSINVIARSMPQRRLQPHTEVLEQKRYQSATLDLETI